MKNLIFSLIIGFLTSISWSQSDKDSIIGTVYNQSKVPISNVVISATQSENKTKSNREGHFSLAVQTQDTLTFTLAGYNTKQLPVLSDTEVLVELNKQSLVDKELIEGSFGIDKDKSEITTAYQVVEADNLNIANSRNNVESLQGKVSGLNIKNNEVHLRAIRSIRASNAALVVIDGMVSTYDYLQNLDYNLIESITVHKGANGAALYGSQAANGVVIVKTKKSLSTYKGSGKSNLEATDFKHSKRIKRIKPPKTPDYIEALSLASSEKEAFKVYKQNFQKYNQKPAYRLDAYSFFYKQKQTSNAKAILNSVINSDSISYSELRAFAYKLESFGKFQEASVVYNKVFRKKPNDVKSYRDMALTYAKMANNQVALNTLGMFLKTDLGADSNNRASNFKTITKHEVNRIIQNDSDLNTSNLASYNIIKTTFDLRIVVDWNQDETDLEVKIVDPNNMICSLENPQTRIGGEFYGIEGLSEYVIRNAREGDYYLLVNTSKFSENSLISVKIHSFKNYGRPSETDEITTITLDKKMKDQALLKISIN